MGTTTFVWDPVFDCVSHELDENNDVKAVYHNEPQQYGGVLSQRRGTTSHYHHHDALGSTRILTDSSGNVTDTYLNDAWGNSIASTGTTVNPFKWVGKHGYYTDDGTGQVYVRARMYQPTTARWRSVDPQEIPEEFNHFSYAGNAPLLFFDPTGLIRISAIGWEGKAPNALKCGDTATSYWSFALTPNQLEKCRSGVIVQHVVSYCEISDCNDNCDCPKWSLSVPLRSPDLQMWEVWFVKDGRVIPAPDKPTGKEVAAVDQSSISLVENTCGYRWRIGTIEYICSHEIDYKVFEAWKSGFTYRSPSQRDSCNMTSGGILSTDARPSWWKTSVSVGHRALGGTWECCKEPCCRRENLGVFSFPASDSGVVQ